MKNFLFFLFVTAIFSGCSIGSDDGPKFHLETLPIDSVVLPVEFKRDSLYELPFKYIRPSTCHIFEGFYYAKNLNIRTIAIQTSVVEQNSCTTATINPITEILKFRPGAESSYIFKIWKGKINGINVYEEFEIPVVP